MIKEFQGLESLFTIQSFLTMYYFYASTGLTFNRLSRRKKGIASNTFFKIPDLFCIFPMNFAMATLGLREMGNFL